MTLIKRDSGYYGWERKHSGFSGEKKRISVSLRTKDRKEAVRRERALDLLVERGEFTVLERLRAGDIQIADLVGAVKSETVDELRGRVEVDLSLGAMVDRVLATKDATRSEGTQRHYQKVCRAMVRKWGRDRSITDISTDEIRLWLYEPKGKRKRPWAPNTQLGAIMVGGYLWRTAIELEAEAVERVGAKPRITRDPWSKLEVNERAKPRKAFLEPHEWNVMLDHARGKPAAALLSLCCLAGLRISEALNLRTGIDVDLAADLIRVQSRDGDFAWTVKHDHSQRNVPIVAELREVLEAHTRDGYAGDRFFIHAPRWDKPLGYTMARTWVREGIERAGLKYGRDGELTAHSLRHTFASWLVREGWSSSLVAALLGNTAKEVDETYAHLAPTDLTKVVATVSKLVSSTARATAPQQKPSI